MGKARTTQRQRATGTRGQLSEPERTAPATPAGGGQPGTPGKWPGQKGAQWLEDVGQIVSMLVAADKRFVSCLRATLTPCSDWIAPTMPAGGGQSRTLDEPPGRNDKEWFVDLGRVVSILVVVGQWFASHLRVAPQSNADRLGPTAPAGAGTTAECRTGRKGGAQ